MRTSPWLALIALASTTWLPAAASAAAFQLDNAASESADVMDGASTWTIDNKHTSVVCAASHYGLSFIYGRFNKCSGSIEMDFQEPNSTKFRFQIDPNSVDTNNSSRDVQLRSSNCLDTARHQTITFESTSVKAEDIPVGAIKTKRTFQVTGNLELHGVTRQITIPIELLAMGNGPEKKMRCGFMSRFVVNRSNFGIDGMKESVGDSIAVTFCFQTVHQEPEPEAKVKAFDLKNSALDGSDFGTDSEREKLKELFRDDTPMNGGESEPDSGQLEKED